MRQRRFLFDFMISVVVNCFIEAKLEYSQVPARMRKQGRAPSHTISREVPGLWRNSATNN